MTRGPADDAVLSGEPLAEAARAAHNLGAEAMLVNGACFVRDAEAIEPEFHRLMFAPVGA